MKKLLLYILLVSVTNKVLANVNQGNWRWRLDNGSESNAQWLGTENSTVTIYAAHTIRLRTELFANAVATPNICLQYSSSLNPTVWLNITNTAGTNAFELAGYSSNVLDKAATTKQLAGCDEGAALNFEPGVVFVSTEAVDKTINPNTKTEVEWAITPTINIQPNVTYKFRVANVNYPTVLPTLLTAQTLPVHLSSFTAKAESGKTKVQWTTKTEVNNDFFEVERSADGNTWTAIAKVKGSGTTTEARSYSTYDNAPLKANNFYRISQHDLDGRVKVSGVVAVKYNVSKLSMLSVYPNPTVKEIRFRLDNVNEKGLTATLTSFDGKLIHRETIATSTTTNLYQLNIDEKPAPGTYILTVRGSGISLNEKVIVR